MSRALDSGIKVWLVTFGQPPVSNAALKEYATGLMESGFLEVRRMVNVWDVVPRALEWYRNGFYVHIGDTKETFFEIDATWMKGFTALANALEIMMKAKDGWERAAEAAGAGFHQHSMSTYDAGLDLRCAPPEAYLKRAKETAESIYKFGMQLMGKAPDGLKDAVKDLLSEHKGDETSLASKELTGEQRSQLFKSLPQATAAGIGCWNPVMVALAAANLAASCYLGHKLDRIEGKVDQLQQTCDDIHIRLGATQEQVQKGMLLISDKLDIIVAAVAEVANNQFESAMTRFQSDILNIGGKTDHVK